MPTFPRTIQPNRAEIPKVASALVSVGESGKIQTRGSTRIGRRWEERWPDLRLGLANVEALLAWIEWAHHTGTVFDVVHTALRGSGQAPLGAGGGTPLVKGASQTGESLATDGWPNNVSGVVAAGDIIKIAGLSHVFRAAESADSDGSGNATLTINPPLIQGSSPSDNAAISTSGNTIRAIVVDYTAPRGRPGQFMSGLQVTFQEAP